MKWPKMPNISHEEHAFWKSIADAYPDSRIEPLGKQLGDTETSDGRILYYCENCQFEVWLPPQELDTIRTCEQCKESTIFTQKESGKC